MSKGSLNILEMHVEKIILGASGAFLLAMLWIYLIGTPSTIEYNNQQVSPRQLDEALLAHAQNLDRGVRNAQATKSPEVHFSAELSKHHKAGIFASTGAPTLPRVVRIAAMFGPTIEVPGLDEQDESAGSIVVVTPLAPGHPVARTGRSLALREQARLAGASQPEESETEEEQADEPVELGWVTVAAYFPKDAQQNEMTKAGYAPYRSRVYVVGVDAQRQEMLASGEFSDWIDASAAKAMPELETLDPIFDDETGAMVNKEDVDQMFNLVKSEQWSIMQPAFYAVEAGDEWKIPALEGYEEEEEEEVARPRPRRQERDKPRKARRQSRPSGGRTGGGRFGGGGVAGGGGGVSLAGGGSGGRATGTRGFQGGGAKAKREAKQQAKRDLAGAKRAMRSRDYEEAKDFANAVVSNDESSPRDQQIARKIVEDAERKIQEQNRASGGGSGGVSLAGGGGRTNIRGGGRFEPDMQPSGAPSEFIQHPESSEPAVWFHDDNVESGKTYRYRLRMRLWNRYVGRKKALQDIGMAKVSTLVGDWSLPSEPVTVRPSAYFFARSPKNDRQAAIVEVWKWLNGEWTKQNFDVTVGDVVGDVKRIKTEELDDEGREIRKEIDFATGHIVLDVRFDEPVKVRQAAGRKGEFQWIERKSMVIVYLDPADGQVKERVMQHDRYDKIRKKLQRDAG